MFFLASLPEQGLLCIPARRRGTGAETGALGPVQLSSILHGGFGGRGGGGNCCGVAC